MINKLLSNYWLSKFSPIKIKKTFMNGLKME